MKYGDLFQASSSLAHCVSQDLKMSLGIAKSFRDTFCRVDHLERQNCKVGQTAFLNLEGRYIYYLITKEKYNGKPTYDSLRQCLVNMKEHMVSNGVREVSMPKIGCGLDFLRWDVVKWIIEDVFQDSNIKITIYCLKYERAKKLEYSRSSKYVMFEYWILQLKATKTHFQTHIPSKHAQKNALRKCVF